MGQGSTQWQLQWASRLGLGEGGGGGARLSRAGVGFVVPAVHAAPAGVHEEVADGGQLQAQLLRDGDLHLLAGPLVLLEDGDECATLQVGEDQPLLLGSQAAVFVLLLLLPLAGCTASREKERERQ